MGRSTTPTFRCEMKISPGATTPTGWDTKHAGRPSDATLKAHVELFEASCLPGGVNAHIGRTVVWSAKIIHQRSGETVATYQGPMFAVV
jgi:hypothetical protein